MFNIPFFTMIILSLFSYSCSTPTTKVVPTLTQPILEKSTQASYIKVENLEQLSTISAQEGVKRWEPSGVAVIKDLLWIVSDRGGRLASYTLPIQNGNNSVNHSWKLKPKLDHRIKWEDLEMDHKGGLWILEAISRSVWYCKQPTLGCPQLERLELDAMNQSINQYVPKAFKYVMFEALTVDEQGPWIGVRGFNATHSGLTPWSFLIRANAQIQLPYVKGLQWKDKTYGLSSAHFDKQANGFWLTWSYEDENREDRSGVSGLLTFLSKDVMPKDVSIQMMNSEKELPMKVCATFPLKPEGVTRWEDQVIIVFDEDKDRKGGEKHQGDKFKLGRHQDYIWSTKIPQCYPM